MSDETKKTDSSNEEKPKIGVFVCHCGGNISDVVDVKKVADELSKVDGVEVATDYEFMCSDPGQNKIGEAIEKDGINRVVVAACSPRLHETTFRRKMNSTGLNPYLLEQANIREQSSWVHKHDPEGATEKAIRLAKASVEKAKLDIALERIKIDSVASALVLGGGVSGLRAALDLAQSDIKVFLIEKTAFLGGNAVTLDKLFPYEDDARQVFKELLDEVLKQDNIEILTNSEVEGITGFIGNYKAQVKTVSRGVTGTISSDALSKAESVCPEQVDSEYNHGLIQRKAIYRPFEGSYPEAPAIDWNACTLCGKCKDALGESLELEKKETTQEIEVGAVVMATGFTHYEPSEGEYGYRKMQNVVTLPQFIRILDSKGPTGGKLEHNGKKIGSIGFIHCVGSRQVEGVHEPQEDGKINNYCSRTCCTATLQAETEVKDRFPDTDVVDFYQDIRTYGRDQEVNYYEKASKQGVLFFRYEGDKPPQVSEGSNGTVNVKVLDVLTQGEEMEAEVDLLVLATGMTPADTGIVASDLKLPKSADRFLLEVHPKLRPVESAVGGVFLAGTAQAPMDITESTAGAGAAAVKAATVLGGGSVELEPNVAKVNHELCEGTGACVEACNYEGAILLEDGKATVNPALCKGCGACVSACPSRAIDIDGFEIKQYEAMVTQITGTGEKNA